MDRGLETKTVLSVAIYGEEYERQLRALILAMNGHPPPIQYRLPDSPPPTPSPPSSPLLYNPQYQPDELEEFKLGEPKPELPKFKPVEIRQRGSQQIPNNENAEPQN